MGCLFKNILSLCDERKCHDSKPLSDVRKNTIVASSKKREDNKYASFRDVTIDIFSHADCYRTYTSKEKILRFLSLKTMIL